MGSWIILSEQWRVKKKILKLLRTVNPQDATHGRSLTDIQMNEYELKIKHRKQKNKCSPTTKISMYTCLTCIYIMNNFKPIHLKVVLNNTLQEKYHHPITTKKN